MKKGLIIITLILITIIISKSEEEIIIPKNSIRIRIIANSNSKKDQSIKLQIKNKINELYEQTIKNIENIEEAKTSIITDINKYEQIIEQIYKDNNYQQKYKIKYGENYFPEKTYQGITYQAGNYESLVITIGEGKGDNWWCVLFPPLCLLENKTQEKVEYRFYVVDTLKKYFE